MQNKRLVDLLSDDSKNSFRNPGITAWKVGAKMILESVGIGTHAYKHGGGEGGGQCHVDVTYRDDFISKWESQTRNCCPSETRPMLGGKHPGECRCACNGC